MLRRLLLAAEILRDVAHEVNAADRHLLESAADDLADRAAELLAGEDAGLDEVTTQLPPIGQPVTGFDGGQHYSPALSVH